MIEKRWKFRLPCYLFDKFNRQSMSSFKILKKSEDRSFEYICNTGYYKFRTNSKYSMIRGYSEPSYDKGLIPKLGGGIE